MELKQLYELDKLDLEELRTVTKRESQYYDCDGINHFSDYLQNLIELKILHNKVNVLKSVISKTWDGILVSKIKFHIFVKDCINTQDIRPLNFSYSDEEKFQLALILASNEKEN